VTWVRRVAWLTYGRVAGVRRSRTGPLDPTTAGPATSADKAASGGAAGTASDAGIRERIDAIQSTAKWLMSAFAAVGAVLVAGIQLADLRTADRGSPLALALAGVTACVVGLGLAIWSLGNVIAPRIPTTTGELARQAADRRSSFARLIEGSPELLQEQADSVAHLHQRLVETRRERHRADQRKLADPGNPAAAAEFARLDAAVQDLRTVAAQLRPIGAFVAARDAFLRARRVAFVGAALVAAGVVAFAYATTPRTASAAAPVVPPSPSAVSVHLTQQGRSLLAGTLGTACPQDFRGIALARDGETYDVVVNDPACSTARLRLTPALGVLTAAAGP
jgi:hypothetical protein